MSPWREARSSWSLVALVPVVFASQEGLVCLQDWSSEDSKKNAINIWRWYDKVFRQSIFSSKHDSKETNLKREKWVLTFVSDNCNCIDLISVSFSATNYFASSSFSCISFTWVFDISTDLKTSTFSNSFVSNSLTCSLSLVSSSFPSPAKAFAFSPSSLGPYQLEMTIIPSPSTAFALHCTFWIISFLKVYLFPYLSLEKLIWW